MRLSHLWRYFILVVVVLGLGVTAAATAPLPSGTLSISTTSIAAGIGVNWGSGVLITHGKRYRFDLQGLEIGGVGVSRVQAKRQGYHLSRVADFTGTYTA